MAGADACEGQRGREPTASGQAPESGHLPPHTLCPTAGWVGWLGLGHLLPLPSFLSSSQGGVGSKTVMLMCWLTLPALGDSSRLGREWGGLLWP